MITLSGEILQNLKNQGSQHDVFFNSKDDGDVFSLLSNNKYYDSIPGNVFFTDNPDAIPPDVIGKEEDMVRLIVHQTPHDNKTMNVDGFVIRDKAWVKMPVQIIPVKSELYSRSKGILETDVFADKNVLTIGLGSVGAPAVLELAKTGVNNFYLIDHDRIEVCNCGRHPAGIKDVGRFKTKTVADMIIDKNPYAQVQTLEEKVCFENKEKIRQLIRCQDLVIITPDAREPKLIMNRLCVEEKITCIFAGAFTRAYGDETLIYRPYRNPVCYQCLCIGLPETHGRDREISNTEQAERIAYSDRPVPIEPGLSSDIAPLSLMIVKLAIQELIRDCPNTTLRSLDEDLVAPLYLWLNRREIGTQYESLEPLEFNIDGLHILRWYGVDLKKHPGCPVCGNFEQMIMQ